MDNQTVQTADRHDPLADDSYNRNPAYNQRRVALCDEDTVTMYFPKRVVLQRDTNPAPAPGEGGYVTFERGVNEVPASLADHQWLRDNGARKYTRTAAESKQLFDQKVADEKARADAHAESVKRADANVAAMKTQGDAAMASLEAQWDSKIKDAERKADELRANAPAPAKAGQ